MVDRCGRLPKDIRWTTPRRTPSRCIHSSSSDGRRFTRGAPGRRSSSTLRRRSCTTSNMTAPKRRTRFRSAQEPQQTFGERSTTRCARRHRLRQPRSILKRRNGCGRSDMSRAAVAHHLQAARVSIRRAASSFCRASTAACQPRGSSRRSPFANSRPCLRTIRTC